MLLSLVLWEDTLLGGDLCDRVEAEAKPRSWQIAEDMAVAIRKGP